MRILYDSQKTYPKSPFGVLRPEELCALRVKIPASCKTVQTELILRCDRTGEERAVGFAREGTDGAYEVWRCDFSIDAPDLYFYWFVITTENERFRLFRLGEHDTNMEAGETWQLSCVSAQYPAPDWARGAVIYQIMPDRFNKAGDCDLSGKLEPYRVHESQREIPDWKPDEKGEVRNCDFFGGNLRGIMEKLPYVAGLGAEIVYLNPIFMAWSNHRYDTCDYLRIDPMLGTEADFTALCDRAHELGLRVILDGVFSHTGSRSVYFDREREFGGGACSDPDSPYRSWYCFKHYPDKYECWWDFPTLPCLNKRDPAYRDFVFGAGGVVETWLRRGADGFRLDVADELPDDFIAGLRARLRQVKPDALLLGEVWEDASNKIAYSVRRRYFVDAELDGVMNYPWRTALLRFVREEDDGTALGATLKQLAENYPADVLSCTMNLLSSHDTARVLTELAAPFEGTRQEMAAYHLTAEQRALGLRRLRLATFLQFMLPGCPSVYYGDEAGMEGCKDPFNRAFYPWGEEDLALRAHFAALGNLRKNCPTLRRGDLRVLQAGGGKLVLCRGCGDDCLYVYANLSKEPEQLQESELLPTVRGEVLLSSDVLDGCVLPGGYAVVRGEARHGAFV